MPNHTRALLAAIAEPWAITAEGLDLIVEVAARDNEVSIEALEAYRARHTPRAERMTQRGSVAIIDARGPMFRYANIFTAISGATSYDVMRRDLQVALDDPSIRAVVLNLDTPGGTVSGADELAKAIFDARSRKPIVAYAGGTAASAGYWLASQASEIVISETAVLGSIGVRAVLTDTAEADRKAGKVEFISSRAPGKRTDLASDEGRARIQRTIDAMEDVFIAAVAKGRGVKTDDVVARFGRGDVLVGAAAVAAGMADRLGSFEQVVAELAEGRSPKPPTSKRTISMTDIPKAEHEAAVAAARKEGDAEGRKAGALAERDRIKAIMALDEAKGREASAQHIALTTDLSAEVAKGILAGLPAASAAEPKTDAPKAPEAAAAGPRAKDAPGGLVTANPADAAPPAAPDKAKAFWKDAISAMNGNVKGAAH
ncbi:S49 family peptidase [Chelatococcus sp. XZ-Ab1]|uniref:S49 family peptidase n=1 Tax=Chelatococcus sp. XZ-Ab1 TaxID=3034027 RepID=UPI0023E3C3A6|nr:S49 family peptidase [Chelatococcus sp. XZ-Ab1]